MPPNRKSFMFSVRLPAALVARLDYVARNTDAEGITNRSRAVQDAIERWLPAQETRLEQLGITSKKAR